MPPQGSPVTAAPPLPGAGCLFEWDALRDTWRGGPDCAALLACGGTALLNAEGALAAVDPQDRARLIALRRTLTPGAPDYVVTLRLRRPDGEEVLVEERGCGFFDDHGRLLRVVGTVVGVLGPERVAAALVQRLLGSPLIGLYIHDLQAGVHVFINPQFTRLTGYTLGTVPGAGGTSFLDLFHPGDQEAIRAHRAALAAAADGETLYLEHRFRHADGHWRWCLSCDSVFTRNADGSVRHVIGTFLDVSARRQAEAALAEQAGLQEQLATVAAAVPGVICSFRLRPDGSSCLPYASPRIEDLCGVSREDLARDAAPVFARMHPEDVGRVRASIEESARTLTPWRDEFRMRRPGRGEIWVEGHSMPVRQTDGSVLWHGYISDVTERKQLEQALQDASRRKDEFLVMLAHELRNPLTPIRNAAHVMRLLDPAEPRLRWVREVIERQVAHLTRLVDDLLDVSRIVRGEVGLKREAIELADLVRDTLEVVQPLLQAKGHRLELRLPPAPVQLDGDPVRLSQVLVNLLDNAAKYTPAAGRIELEAQTEAEGVVLRVRDNGPGIPPQLLPLVFDLFQQGERPLDRAQGGLGIGLTLVRRLVELHGGRVAAQSEGPGQGSTFTVWLPRACGPPPTRATQAPDSRGAGPRVRILVVDDDPTVLESTALWLELEGHQVRAARGGAEALAQASAFRPQVVLLDIGLRGMDGYETAQRLRELPGGRAVRLVAVTGYGHDEARARSAAAGFDAHLVKPLDPVALAAVLAAVAAGRPRADA